jgi:uncharacterized RDD family membrane protein YckC
LSTLGQPHLEPAWKQEVARRLAAHKTRKGATSADTPAQPHNMGNSRAAEAAARVAARFAHAPSYSELQAEEARMAVRAAEIATKVALEAQAVAESALAELHVASSEQPSRGPAVVESISRARIETALVEPEIAEPVLAEPEVATSKQTLVDAVSEPVSDPLVERASEPAYEIPIVITPPEPIYTEQIIDGQTFGIRWDADTPIRVLQPKPAPAADPFELETEDWWTPAQVTATLRSEPFEVESQQTTANLIEFPRELVATRKMRPRLAEPVQSASATERQLSIFEVDPGAISTEPAAPETIAPAWSDRAWSDQTQSAPAGSAPAWSDRAWSAPAASASTWSGPETPGWSGMELGEHPLVENRPEPEPVRAPQRIFLAPLGYRLMAMMVDGCLILASFFAMAIMMAGRMQQAPAPHSAEAMAVMGLVLIGFLYNAFFCAFGVSTPGMCYAGIALSTFDDESPTRTQLGRRLGLMALSLLPVGLGLAWSVFDEDRLTWHDRISQTYLRKR